MLENFQLWIEGRTFAEWVAVGCLIVASIGLFINKTKSKKLRIKATKGSVAFGNKASGNSITLNAEPKDSKNDKEPDH
jgi:hypothetical protein